MNKNMIFLILCAFLMTCGVAFSATRDFDQVQKLRDVHKTEDFAAAVDAAFPSTKILLETKDGSATVANVFLRMYSEVIDNIAVCVERFISSKTLTDSYNSTSVSAGAGSSSVEGVFEESPVKVFMKKIADQETGLRRTTQYREFLQPYNAFEPIQNFIEEFLRWIESSIGSSTDVKSLDQLSSEIIQQYLAFEVELTPRLVFDFRYEALSPAGQNHFYELVDAKLQKFEQVTLMPYREFIKAASSCAECLSKDEVLKELNDLLNQYSDEFKGHVELHLHGLRYWLPVSKSIADWVHTIENNIFKAIKNVFDHMQTSDGADQGHYQLVYFRSKLDNFCPACRARFNTHASVIRQILDQPGIAVGGLFSNPANLIIRDGKSPADLIEEYRTYSPLVFPGADSEAIAALVEEDDRAPDSSSPLEATKAAVRKAANKVKGLLNRFK